MKKFIVAFACIAMLASACGNTDAVSSSSAVNSSSSMSTSQSSSMAERTLDDLVQLALAKMQPAGEMLKLSDKAVNQFYTLPEGTKHAIYVSAVFEADEIAILELEGAKDKLVEAVDARLTALKNSFKDYKTDVYSVVDENAVIYTAGDHVIFISGSAENVAAAKTALEEAYGEELKAAK